MGDHHWTATCCAFDMICVDLKLFVLTSQVTKKNLVILKFNQSTNHFKNFISHPTPHPTLPSPHSTPLANPANPATHIQTLYSTPQQIITI